MNFESARHNMISQQLRTWRVSDPAVLDQMHADRREDFVPEAYRALAFADVEIPVGPQASLLPPKLEGRILQALALQPRERVLEVGAGSGHMAALLAASAKEVVTIEIDPAVAELARDNLRRQSIENVQVQDGDGLSGCAAQAPFDAIVVSGGVHVVPQALLEQLAVGGRLIAFVGSGTPQIMQCLTRVAIDAIRTENVLETSVPMLRQTSPARFSF